MIQLHNSGLTGALPLALISQLRNLKALLLHENTLTGPSPLGLLSGEVR